MTSSDFTMADADKEAVYLAYRDVFVGDLAKLRKRSKVRNVVEQHKDHLHHRQLAESVGSERTCVILSDLLTAQLFENETIAQATFPALFSSMSALVVKCVEDEYNAGSEQTNAAPLPRVLRSSGRRTLATNRIDSRSGGIRKPRAASQAARETIGRILRLGEENEAKEDRARVEDDLEGPRHYYDYNSSPIDRVPLPLYRAQEGKCQEQPRLSNLRDPTVSTLPPTDHAHLPFKLQHLLLTQTQQILEACCYSFAKKWFPTLLIKTGWDIPEAVELNQWWGILSHCDIPIEAISLRPGDSLKGLFTNAKIIRNNAVHRHPQIPIKRLQEMIRDAAFLAQALKDDLRAAQLLSWYRELERSLVQLQAQRATAEAELRSIRITKVETEERLAGLKARESELVNSLGGSKRHRSIHVEALRSLEEAISNQAPMRASPATALVQVWRWVGNSLSKILT